MKREKKIRDGLGELVPLKIKISKLGELGEVSGQGPGEVVEAEAEGAESGQVGESVGWESPEERRSGEAKNGNAVILTLNTLPVAWGGQVYVPKQSAATDGGPQSQERGPVGGKI